MLLQPKYPVLQRCQGSSLGTRPETEPSSLLVDLNALGLITGAAKCEWQGCLAKGLWMFDVTCCLFSLFVHVMRFQTIGMMSGFAGLANNYLLSRTEMSV